MLKIYDKLDDVPEAYRADYKQAANGKFVADLSNDHPTVIAMNNYRQEKETEEARVKKLRSDLDDALEAGKTSGVPRGQALVAKADAEDLPKYRALGSVDEVTAKVTEHAALKESEVKRQREDKQRLVAKELGFDNPDAFVLLSNLPDFEIRDGKDGKKQVIALVKDGDKTVEKPAMEFLESSPNHAPLLPALKTKQGVTVHGTSSTTTTQKPGDPFAWAKSFAENYSKQGAPTTQSLYESFNITKQPA